MKNIFKIYKKDLVKIFTNWVALVVVIGLIILPSLYAWFNIKSSWDPYGNTKGIKVAIVNEDTGASYKDKNINVGDELVNELKKNENLGWNFVTSEEAKYGVERGEYFASITIPKDFSQDIISLTSKDIKRPDLVYTVNEAANAIAPKITDKGVETLKQNVDSTIVKTVNGIIFKIFNDIGFGYINERPKIQDAVKLLYNLNDNSDKIGDLINKAYNGTITVNQMIDKVNAIVPSLEKTLNSADNVLNSSETFLNNSKQAINKISPMVKEDLGLAKKFIDGTLTISDSIESNVDKDTIIKNLSLIKDRLNSANNIVSTLSNLLNNINQNGKLDGTIGKLNNLKDKINNTMNVINSIENTLNGNGVINSADIQQLKSKLKNVSSGINEILNSYDSTILPKINESMDSLIALANNGEETIQKTKEALPKVKETLGLLKKGTALSNTELKKLKDNYPEMQKSLSKIVGKIKEVDKGDNVDSILSLLTNNWESESNFLGNPVNIKENRLFKIPNYGSAMSPFYTTLSLWVGGLILVSILTVSVKGIDKEKENIKPHEVFFGKYLTFISIGILQGFVVTMGDIFILKTYVLNKFGFVLLGMFISLVFITIIYSIVSVFGNIGKAICIIFLVLQVAASGGTFPVQVMSGFFKGINPFLPFKYAIDGMRYLVAGGVQDLFMKDLAILAALIIPCIVIGAILKKPLNKASEKFIKKLAESEIVEH